MFSGNSSLQASQQTPTSIPLPTQQASSNVSAATETNSAATNMALNQSMQVPPYQDYSSEQYQQYYQQYYANAYSQSVNAYAQQQYAAYYQAGSSNQATLYNSVYPNTQINLLTGIHSALAATTDPAYDQAQEEDEDDDDPTIAKSSNATKPANILPIHCNDKMGLNPLIYSNIQQSPYFKNNLFQLKTYHEVIDEIYYNVKHLEPWEKGSRKVSGQTGLCGSVRGVGAGGIISTPFCILYKLFTLRLTRKQVNGLIRHKDSPFIRALGFMYIRYTQPPKDLWQWFEPFLEDEEVVDPKAGGGGSMTIGEMVRDFLTKLDWFSTLFPRIPIPVQKDIEEKLKNYDKEKRYGSAGGAGEQDTSKKSNGQRNNDNKSDYSNKQHRSESSASSKYPKSDVPRSRRSRSRSRDKSPAISSSGNNNNKYYNHNKANKHSKRYDDSDGCRHKSSNRY